MKAILYTGRVTILLAALSGGADAQSEKVLFSFGSIHGSLPGTNGNLLMLSNGHLFGTAQYGGAKFNSGLGIVFEGIPPTKKNPSWRESVIYRFPTTSGGYDPWDGLTAGQSGVLYGETYLGGQGAGNGCGVVYQLTPPSQKGGKWTESAIHFFTGPPTDGCGPYNTQLLLDSTSGSLYGTTKGGGSNNGGTLFRLDPGGNGSWTETILYSFGSNQFDGVGPIGAITEDSNGVIYGTSEASGAFSAGTVWIYDTATSQFDEIYQFQGGTDGATPTGGLIGPFLASPQTQQYYLLGTTSAGGGSTNCIGGCGTVVAINLAPVINETTDTVVHAFQGGSDGSDPIPGLVAIAGNYWGVANEGGSTTSYCPSGCGTLFELQTSGLYHNVLKYVPIYNFAGPPDGAHPQTGVAGNSAGDIFGSTELGGSYDDAGGYFGSLWSYTP
jgi:uncharacterized repeat protein (TIGR03803 family)